MILGAARLTTFPAASLNVPHSTVGKTPGRRCKESRLLDISEDSMLGAIALNYYFIACGIKAQCKFLSSPVDELPGMQKTIYDELPQSFETRTDLVIAERYGMPERTFKRWPPPAFSGRLPTASMRNVIDNPLWHDWHFRHIPKMPIMPEMPSGNGNLMLSL